MKLSLVLTIASVYLGLVGLGYLISPEFISLGAIDASASDQLKMFARISSSAFLGIAVLNWMARNSDKSNARDAIVMGNTVGFALAAVLGVWMIVQGAPTGAWGFLAINVLVLIGFLMSGRAGN